MDITLVRAVHISSAHKLETTRTGCRHQHCVKQCFTNTITNLEEFECGPVGGSFAALALPLLPFTKDTNDVFLLILTSITCTARDLPAV